MSLIEIKAYKCEWCGRLFPNDHTFHVQECRYDPSARTCISCIYGCELKRPSRYDNDDNKPATGVYCPRADELFVYPHKNYCHSYKKAPGYTPYGAK